MTVLPTLSALLIGLTPAIAMPTAPKAAKNVIQIQPVAMGCGAGRARDATGVCRRRFNLFHRHDRFKTYKQRRCTPVRTPNGKVGFCRV